MGWQSKWKLNQPQANVGQTPWHGMDWHWKNQAPAAGRIAKKVFFFYKSSYSVRFPSDPVRQTIRYRHPLARALVGWLPYAAKKPFLRLRVTERIVEYPFVLRQLDLPLGSTILDLGATGSALALQLANFGYRVIATDVRPYPFTHPKLEFREGNFLQNSLPPESVDAVLAISTLEHMGIPYYGGPSVADGDLLASQEIWRLLKPGGYFLLTVPYGKAAQTSHQRVYDHARLGKLLERFQLQELNYYRCENDGCCWMRVDEAAMRTVSSVHQPKGIVLVRASKPADKRRTC